MDAQRSRATGKESKLSEGGISVSNFVGERDRQKRTASNESVERHSESDTDAATVTSDRFDRATAKANWKGKKGESRWAIYCGDALKVLGDMPDEWVDCAVTSPPYFWLRDYGVEGQIGLERSVDEYVSNICSVMAEVKRVLRRDGVLFLNVGDTYYSGKGRSHGVDRKSSKRRFGVRAVDKSGGLGINMQRKSLIGIPWRVAIALSAKGWVLRSSIIWYRVNPLPENVRDRPSRSYEYVFMLAKDRRYFFDKRPLIEHEIDEDVWSIPARPRISAGLDTASFPDELVERCLDVGCRKGGVVIDPFLGAGTTVRVAVGMGLFATGIDLKREFCEHAAGQMTET